MNTRLRPASSRSAHAALVSAGIVILGLIPSACGGEMASGAASQPPPPASAPPPVASAPPPPVQAAPPPPPPVAVDVEQPEGTEHRHRHGGIGALIAMSLKDLDLTAEQRTAIDKIKADLEAKMEPARAAGKDVAAALADGVAAGKVDRKKVEAAIGKMTAQIETQQPASLEALNQLHAALTPEQRTALSDALVAHYTKWREAQGHDEAEDGKFRSGHMLALVKDLGISPEEADQIKSSFKALVKATPQEAEPPKVEAHLQALATAFKAEKFDAKTLKTTPSAGASMAKWSSTRMERFLEAAAPILTAEQRTKLADMIRSRAS